MARNYCWTYDEVALPKSLDTMQKQNVTRNSVSSLFKFRLDTLQPISSTPMSDPDAVFLATCISFSYEALSGATRLRLVYDPRSHLLECGGSCSLDLLLLVYGLVSSASASPLFHATTLRRASYRLCSGLCVVYPEHPRQSNHRCMSIRIYGTVSFGQTCFPSRLNESPSNCHPISFGILSVSPAG